MIDQDFVNLFSRQKEAFLKEYKKNSYEKALSWFERWLQEEKVKTEGRTDREQGNFEDFIEQVLSRTGEILQFWGVKMAYPSPERWLGIKGSWRCIRVLENPLIYYRLGKTRPRKGPYQNQEILIFDLVMDGQKKQVFLPVLMYKREIELELGEVLERELPKVEATGKYRLKLVLPFHLVERWEVELTSKKLAGFILATKKALNKIGIV
ncbi:MAG: hypothetical protein K6U04_07690 [Armatimonadetes bacterium]|nr:hypothetical protein [Armatimonadota bacterium]